MSNGINRLLIVGASGYIGSALCSGLKDQYEIFGTYCNNPIHINRVTTMQLNCLNGGEVIEIMKKIKPECIIFCAGFSDLDLCDQHPQLSEALNFQTASLFFRVTSGATKFIYFSTDQVFSGLNRKQPIQPYAETDQAQPLHQYGKSKVSAENMTISSQNSCVLRVALPYGEPFGKTTVPRVAWNSILQSKLEKDTSVAATSDQVHSHVYIGDVVRATRLLLTTEKWKQKIYNIAGPEALSRYDFAKLFCKHMGFDELLVKGIPAESLYKSGAKRPLYTGMSSKLFEKDFEFQFQGPEEGLQEFAQRMKTGFTSSWT